MMGLNKDMYNEDGTLHTGSLLMGFLVQGFKIIIIYPLSIFPVYIIGFVLMIIMGFFDIDIKDYLKPEWYDMGGRIWFVYMLSFTILWDYINNSKIGLFGKSIFFDDDVL